MVINFVEKYKNLSDEELVKLCRSFDEAAFAVIIRRYTPMVSAKVSQVFAGISHEHDDLVQEGFIAVLSAINSYDFSSASFATYVRVCVDRALISVFRRENAKKKIPSDMVVGLSDSDIKSPETPESTVLEKESVGDWQFKLKDILSNFEYDVIKAYLSGLSVAEISSLLSVDRKAVNNALCRIRRKLKSSC